MQRQQRIEITAHIAHGGDAVRQQQRDHELPAAGWLARRRQVKVHVGQPRNQVFIVAIDDRGAPRNVIGLRRRNRGNLVPHNQHGHVALRRRAGHIDQRNVGNGQRRLAPPAGTQRHTHQNTHAHEEP